MRLAFVRKFEVPIRRACSIYTEYCVAVGFFHDERWLCPLDRARVRHLGTCRDVPLDTQSTLHIVLFLLRQSAIKHDNITDLALEERLEAS